MEAIRKTTRRYGKTTGILLLGAAVLVWLLMKGYASQWTGFGAADSELVSAKTLWDWMDLLLVPFFLAGTAVLLRQSGQHHERQRVTDRLAIEQDIETDRQQEEALQAYFDRIIELVLKDKLSKFSPDDVRNVARTRTLAVLRRLDPRRKGMVVLFLRDSRLIDRHDAVIDLCGADLRGALLAHASLKRLNLAEADLRDADLRGANLGKCYLSAANLSGAHLEAADLSGADLFEANLNGAFLNQSKLREANLNGADLRGCRLIEADIREADLTGVNLNVSDLVKADLRGANLDGVKLLGADLTQADLSGTQILETELEKAKSLEGTTMPDGSRHH